MDKPKNYFFIVITSFLSLLIILSLFAPVIIYLSLFIISWFFSVIIIFHLVSLYNKKKTLKYYLVVPGIILLYVLFKTFDLRSTNTLNSIYLGLSLIFVIFLWKSQIKFLNYQIDFRGQKPYKVGFLFILICVALLVGSASLIGKSYKTDSISEGHMTGTGILLPAIILSEYVCPYDGKVIFYREATSCEKVAVSTIYIALFAIIGLVVGVVTNRKK